MLSLSACPPAAALPRQQRPAGRGAVGRAMAVVCSASPPPPASGAGDATRRGVLSLTAAAAVASLTATPPPALALTASPTSEEMATRGSGAGAYNLDKGFSSTANGLRYLDMRVGEGTETEVGKRVVVDWDGFTIHLSHVIEAKLLAKGGAFQGDDTNLLRFTLGDGSMIPAFDEALVGMRAGGVRRILVPPGQFSYPLGNDGKQTMDMLGPRPSTFSGRRALDFVLKNNGNIDKTLLFDLEVLEVSPTGQARRGPGKVVVQP
mmetsp:Transcript_28646/g.91370  ORF Transcript_28646/g.91370 Transcript_28646/m.91370 type:complete len:263 (-) Transcript_28646:17-805(-)